MDEGTWDILKSACSNSFPAGENCEYQPAFLELMSLATPRPEIQMGSTVIAARLPEWSAILQHSLAMSQRTRDLRVGVVLTESLAQTHSWNGLAEGLEILWCWTTQLWSDLFPELDKEESDDPTARLSALAHIVSDEFFSRTLYQLPLAEHEVLGALRLRDTLTIHKGKKEVTRQLSPAEIEAFFTGCDPVTLAMRMRNLDRCCAALEALDEFLNNQPGTSQWSASRLLDILHRGREILHKHLSNHQMFLPQARASQPLPSAEQNAEQNAERSPAQVAERAVERAVERPTSAPGSAVLPLNQIATVAAESNSATLANQHPSPDLVVAGVIPPATLHDWSSPLPIRSRHDATQAIDAVCDYFQNHEPASPVPLLLQRAKRLISMNFVELMHELAPNEALQLLRQLHVVDKAG